MNITPTLLRTTVILAGALLTSQAYASPTGISALGSELSNLNTTDLTKQHTQNDGSLTHAVESNQFLGVRVDKLYAYSTPISKKVAGLESFTRIKPHHCQPFLSATTDYIVNNELQLTSTQSPGSVSAVSSDGDLIIYAECGVKTDDPDEMIQFSIGAYSSSTQDILTKENKKIVTGLN